MKLSDIKVGMILETREGNKFLVLPFNGVKDDLYGYCTKTNTRVTISRWNEYLFNRCGLVDDDIVKVYALKEFTTLLSGEGGTSTLIWERPTTTDIKKYVEEMILQMENILHLL